MSCSQHITVTVDVGQTVWLPRIPAQQLERLGVLFTLTAFPSHYWSTAGEHARSFQCFVVRGVLG